MLLNIDDYRRAARRTLPGFVFDYVDGAADDNQCLARNRRDLDAVTLVPRVLRDTRSVDTALDVFGTRWRFPFAIAPTGLNGLIRPGGDAALARAAAAMGVPFTQSTASNQRLETVRQAAPDNPHWLQLYVMQDRAIAEQLVRRARQCGVQALVLTVDVPVSGNRESDARNGFSLPLRPTAKLAWDLASHPRWSLRMARSGAPRFANLVEHPDTVLSAQAQAALLSRAMDRSLVWDSLQWLRSLWDGPLLLKGILHPQDAAHALQHGVDGLIVSNHGGRQLDAAPSAISVLPAIVQAVRGQIPVFMDSGVRRGSDVARALALGARAVFIGRPVLYGLATSGQAGAEAVMQILARELTLAMTLLGAGRLQDLVPQVDDTPAGGDTHTQ
ncbi:MAG TPA: alpha-hydroxy acid oxidase [Burkholderiaceae bacterium]|nr:alpha-hydroxy acid oxidase [Burkholderiaceae bacterium]